MTVVQTVATLGGSARWADLRRQVSQKAIERALREGQIVRVRRGLFCAPERLDQTRLRAAGAVISHLSAAEMWELGVLERPMALHVTVRRNHRRVVLPEAVVTHYADLRPQEIHRGTTTVLRTVLDCGRTCPFPQALAIADTAIRTGHVTQPELMAAATSLRGPGSARARRVATCADPRAMSPPESVLRAVLIDGGISGFVPQFRARARGRWIATVDLGDPATGVLLEADSFFWHGQRAALERDARRYDELVAAGYVVLRFTWEHIVGDPGWVVSIVRRVLARHGAEPQEQSPAA